MLCIYCKVTYICFSNGNEAGAVKRNKMKRDIIKKIEELEAGIRYCIAQIASTTENWIKKEYMGVIASHEAEISELKHRLQFF